MTHSKVPGSVTPTPIVCKCVIAVFYVYGGAEGVAGRVSIFKRALSLVLLFQD